MKNVLERLINLLVMLLTSSRPVLAEEIRRTIPGYSADSDEAFHRMFERDKDLLRGIGIPIELRPTDGWEVLGRSPSPRKRTCLLCSTRSSGWRFCSPISSRASS